MKKFSDSIVTFFTKLHFYNRLNMFLAIITITALAVIFWYFSKSIITEYKNNKNSFEGSRIAAEIPNQFFRQDLLGALEVHADGNRVFNDVLEGKRTSEDELCLNILTKLKNNYKAITVYLVNVSGTVVICTPYGDGKSLTGNNYAFRPYFRKALAGNKAVFIGLEVKTKEREIYYAVPVNWHKTRDDIFRETISGVLVVKMNLTGIDSYLERQGVISFISGSESRILASARADWLFRNVYGVKEENPVFDLKNEGELVDLSTGKTHNVVTKDISIPYLTNNLKLTIVDKAEDPFTLIADIGVSIIIVSALIGLFSLQRFHDGVRVFSRNSFLLNLLNVLFVLLGAGYLQYKSERDTALRDRENKEKQEIVVAKAISSQLQELEHRLEQLGLYFSGSEFISPDEFRGWANDVLMHLNDIKDIRWSGFTGNRQGSKHVIYYYSTVFEEWGIEAVRSLEIAAKTGKPVFTSVENPEVQQNKKNYLAVPVFRHNSKSENRVFGVLAGKMDFVSTIESMIKRFSDKQIFKVKIADITIPGQEPEILFSTFEKSDFRAGKIRFELADKMLEITVGTVISGDGRVINPLSVGVLIIGIWLNFYLYIYRKKKLHLMFKLEELEKQNTEWLNKINQIFAHSSEPCFIFDCSLHQISFKIAHLTFFLRVFSKMKILVKTWSVKWMPGFMDRKSANQDIHVKYPDLRIMRFFSISIIFQFQRIKWRWLILLMLIVKSNLNN